MSSPSSKHIKSSKSKSFLSSRPIAQTISLSKISEMKYCGKPLLYTIFSPVFSMCFIRYGENYVWQINMNTQIVIDGKPYLDVVDEWYDYIKSIKQ